MQSPCGFAHFLLPEKGIQSIITNIYEGIKKGVRSITFQLDFEIGLVSVITLLIGCGMIGFLSFRIYRKQDVKPTIWKIILVLLIGLFSFSFNMNFFDTFMKLPILPLGVWILYFFLKSKKGRWDRFRKYAWLGFFANFLFLVLSFTSIGLQHVIYSPSNLSTYISNVENATIINTHPSAGDVTLQKDQLLKLLPVMKETKFFSDKWYEETYMSGEPNTRKERFPYQVVGVKEKWGSGVVTTIVIEDDGKGLLITTPKNQYYFRSPEVFLEGVKSK